jgi:predicted transglutaminase-like cysteine proteinase
MSKRQRARNAALLAIVVGLGALATARPAQASAFVGLPNSTNKLAVVSMVLAAPFDGPDVAAAPRPAGQPFGRQEAAPVTGSLQALWQSAASRLPTEYGILARCRADSTQCPPAATRLLAVISRAAQREGLTRIAEINRAINLDVRPVSDVAQYGASPIWPTPLMTFAINAGDCKDYALAKYVALRELGFSADDLRIVVGYIRASGEYHAITTIRYAGRWLILDNRTSEIRLDGDIADYEPLFVIDGQRVRHMMPSRVPQDVNVDRRLASAKWTLFAWSESFAALV